METLGIILVIVYAVLGYWAAGQTVYADKIRIGTASNLFITRLIVGCLLGILLIPIAIIKKIASK